MRWRKKTVVPIMDEYTELHLLLHQQKQIWDNYESYLNSIDDMEQMEQWTYKTLIQKQIYRYFLRLVKEYYEGGGQLAKYRTDCCGNTTSDIVG